jgi:hypothetical protein
MYSGNRHLRSLIQEVSYREHQDLKVPYLFRARYSLLWATSVCLGAFAASTAAIGSNTSGSSSGFAPSQLPALELSDGGLEFFKV